MAFRKKMFEMRGGFQANLGRSSGHEIPLRSEDAEFGPLLLAGAASSSGRKFSPSFITQFPEKRIRKKCFLGWRFDCGHADA
jgi:hypothetical protein